MICQKLDLNRNIHQIRILYLQKILVWEDEGYKFLKTITIDIKMHLNFASYVQKTKQSNIWIINLHNLVRLTLSTTTQDLHFSLKTKLNKAFPTKRGGIFWFNTFFKDIKDFFLSFQCLEFWKWKSCFL